MSTVQLAGAVALAGRFPALAGVDLEVDEGEVVVLQGPNGAGKTSLLRLCAALSSLESGRGRVCGFDLGSHRREIRRRVGLLGHAVALYEDLTPNENLAFWARAGDAPLGEVDAALDRLEVPERQRDVVVRRLSAGQQRRVALAVLVIRRPQLWLLDEPHATLDQTGRRLVDALVHDAAAAGGTVLLSSHELERVRALGTRLVTLAGGVVHHDEALGSGA